MNILYVIISGTNMADIIEFVMNNKNNIGLVIHPTKDCEIDIKQSIPCLKQVSLLFPHISKGYKWEGYATFMVHENDFTIYIDMHPKEREIFVGIEPDGEEMYHMEGRFRIYYTLTPQEAAILVHIMQKHNCVFSSDDGGLTVFN